MKWLNFFVKIADGKQPHICPVCGLKEARFQVHFSENEQGAGYVEAWCDSCLSRDMMNFRGWDPNKRLSA